MREIEMKAKIENSGEIIKRLEKLGRAFGEPIFQNDTIFADPSIPFAEFRPNINLLRIREQGGQIVFTLKRPQTNEFDAIEHEVKIDNRKKLEEIIKYLGIRKWQG